MTEKIYSINDYGEFLESPDRETVDLGWSMIYNSFPWETFDKQKYAELYREFNKLPSVYKYTSNIGYKVIEKILDNYDSIMEE